MIISEETPPSVQDSLLALCLYAAFGDGDKDNAEREEIKRIAEEIGSENLSSLSRRILMQKLPLSEVIAGLTSQNDRLLGYEMALAVCEASGSVSGDERAFLDDLRTQLGLGEGEAAVVKEEVDLFALAPLVPATLDPASPPPLTEAPGNRAMILKYAILNGALELLPETLASLAIIPMQMKMVYRIGKTHGNELDRAHIKEFLATVGVGMGSQIAEGFARKLMRGLGRKAGGKTAGKVADQLTGSVMSFATTYALGMVAEKYYEAGRKVDFSSVKAFFLPLKAEAEALHSQYLPEMQAQAKDLTPGRILALVKEA